MTQPVSEPSAQSVPWRQVLAMYVQPNSLRMLGLGFSAGLPLLLVLGTLSFRLREAGIDRTTIGYLSWVALAYAFKWCWAPLVDRMPLPGLTAWLGRRRSWLLVSQLLIAGGLLGMGWLHPQTQLDALVACALLVAFASATQDIALDAFRIESAQAEQQGVLAASYQTGYRLAMIWAGAGVLKVAAWSERAVATTVPPLTGLAESAYRNGPWQDAYMVMAASMLLGVVMVLASREPVAAPQAPTRNVGEWLQEALVQPFADFFQRHGKLALGVLLLIGTYRISDIVMGVMANPFYVDMGYTKDEVADVTKVYGVVMGLLGAFVGGGMTLRWGVTRMLMAGAVLSAATNVLFAWLSTRGHDVWALVAVVSADNLAGGIASAAFIAYLSSLTNVKYSATQYALFSSMMLLAPKWLAGFSGAAVDQVGYAAFFMGTALLGVPVLVLVAVFTKLYKADTPR